MSNINREIYKMLIVSDWTRLFFVFIQAAYNCFRGEVWSTYSDISGLRFGIIFAADLKNYTIMIGPTEAGWSSKVKKTLFLIEN